MRKLFIVAALAATAVLGVRGCSFAQWGGPAGQADVDELTNAASQRLEQRRTADGGEASGPGRLAGMIEPVETRDGVAELTLEQAVRRTLASSLDIQVAGFTPAIRETDITVASAVFDPMYFLTGSILNEDTPVASILASGGAPAVMQDSRTVGTGITKPLATGGEITVSENLDYLRSSSTFITSPSYSTNFMVELSHPILRDMGLETNKAQIYIATHARDASLEEFRRQVMDVLVELESTYWELAFAIRDVEVRKRSVALAEEVLRKERRRVELQMARPLEVSRARAAATTRRAELIRAQNEVRNLSDRLKNIMNDPDLGLDESVRIMPADAPKVAPQEPDRNRAVADALAYRPELRRLRNEIQGVEVRKRFNRNQLLPKLDVSFFWRRNSLGQSSSDAFKDQLTGDFTDYQAAVNFEVPIGNREAEAQLRRSRLEYAQSLRQLDNISQDVMLDVNTAIREIETNWEEVLATREARVAAKDTLDGEQSRYDVGDVTNEELLRAQRDLEEAERNELRAITRFNITLVNLERVKGTLLKYNGIEVVPAEFRPDVP